MGKGNDSTSDSLNQHWEKDHSSGPSEKVHYFAYELTQRSTLPIYVSCFVTRVLLRSVMDHWTVILSQCLNMHWAVFTRIHGWAWVTLYIRLCHTAQKEQLSYLSEILGFFFRFFVEVRVYCMVLILDTFLTMLRIVSHKTFLANRSHWRNLTFDREMSHLRMVTPDWIGNS